MVRKTKKHSRNLSRSFDRCLTEHEGDRYESWHNFFYGTTNAESLRITGRRVIGTLANLPVKTGNMRMSRSRQFHAVGSTWTGFSKAVDETNAVYGSQNISGRINRRASRKTLSGKQAVDTGISPHVTSVRHGNVNRLPAFQA